jgi:hypothetical protein
MPNRPTHNLHYTIENIAITVDSNSSSRLASIDSYLSLPKFNHGSVAEHNLSLTCKELSENLLDHFISLPDLEHLECERTLLVDRNVPYRVYVKNGQSWVDYRGFGRSHTVRSLHQAKTAVINNCGISEVYTDILFSYNPLLSLLGNYGYQTVHASCAQVNGKGVLFTGKSGSGKSTAAYAMLRRGHPVLADDRILIKKANPYQALAISDVIKIGCDALAKFFPELLLTEPLHLVAGDYYYKISSATGLAHLNQINLNCLVIFERTGTAASRYEEVNPARVVGSLFPVTMSNYNSKSMQNKFDFLMDFLENVRCYRLYFGTNMDDFANQVEKLVNNY